MSKHLNLNDIIQATNVKEKQFEVPEWGGHIIIREMTAEARDAYEQSLFVANEKGEFERNLSNARAKLIAACVVGPDGQRMFQTEQHVKALGNMPVSVVDKVFTACQEINALSADDVKELAGN